MTEYTVDDLVKGAHQRGFKDVTARLVVDWVQRGLIDRPTKSGLGKGGGRGTSKGKWSEFQRDLFLREVEQHHAGARRIATLCNLPVFVWLWWGDDWVPLRQVMRAMDTYRRAYRKSSANAGRITGTEVARDLGNPGGSRHERRLRQDFIQAVAEMSPTGRITDAQRAELVRLAERVFDAELLASPFAKGLAAGYVQLIEARLIAIERLPHLAALDYYWERHVYVMTRAESGQEFPRLAEDPAVAKRFRPPTLDEVANRACIDLLTTIGLVDMAERETDPVRGAAFDRRRSPLMESFPYERTTPEEDTA